MKPSGADSAVELPAPDVLALTSLAYAAVATLWLPLTVIPLLDGLLFVAPISQVVGELGVLWLLGLLPALLLALLGVAAHLTVRRLLPRAGVASIVAWSLALAPLAWVCAWQLSRVTWMWIKAVAGFELTITPSVRLAAASFLLIGVAWAWNRWGLCHLLRRVLNLLESLRTPALLLLALAGVTVAVHPPALLRHAPDARTGAIESGRSIQPDVFLISLDTLTAVDSQPCGEATLMPRLHAFARGASCFTRFYATSNFTTPTVSSMETGLLPWSHFATQPDASIDLSLRSNNFPAVLVAQGYLAHAITDNLLASARHRGTAINYHSTDFAHTTLFGNLFREAMTVFPNSQLPKLAAAALSFLGVFDMHLHGDQSPYDSRRSYEAALARLASAASSRPIFLWAHSLPPHSPYLPTADTKYRLLPPGELERWQDLLPDNIDYPPALQPQVDKHRLRYQESILAADARLGEFLDELERQGRLDRALVIITSDHGESFEKGYYGHAGVPLHDPLLRVPLVVKLPGQRLGQVIDRAVSQADLAPTILEIVGAPPLPFAEGQSLRPILSGQTQPEAPVFAMSMERQSRFTPIRRGRYAMIDGDHKLEWDLDAGTKRLFNLAADPGESRDLASAQTDRVRAMTAAIETRLRSAESRRAQAHR